MKEIKNIKTRYYEYDEYIIIIEENKDSFESWINKKDIGYKMFLLGFKKENNIDILSNLLSFIVEEFEMFKYVYNENLEKLESEVN